MSEKEARSMNALTLLRRTGATPSMALVRAATGLEFSSSLTRMILKNIHTAFLTKKPEEIQVITNEGVVGQKDGEAPIMQMVRIAVKRYATSGRANEWDESINWEPNSKKWAGGLKQSSKSSLPRQQFVYIEVPYDKWRNHYAKDKDGRYRGKLAPAENCILLPEDEHKRNPEPPTDNEDTDPQIKPLQRSDTAPEHYEDDLGMSLEEETGLGDISEKEEAIFIEPDGHAGLQMVEKSEVERKPEIQKLDIEEESEIEMSQVKKSQVESIPEESSDLPKSASSPTSQEPPMSPTSITSPTSDEPPTSPISKKRWKDRLGKSTKFSLRRSSSDKVF